jgi:hypothetical protein
VIFSDYFIFWGGLIFVGDLSFLFVSFCSFMDRGVVWLHFVFFR